MQAFFFLSLILPIQIVQHFFGIGCGDFSWCGFNTPVIGAIVLIDKFGQYVYIFECVGSREIAIQFRFKGSIKSFDDTGFGISMSRKVMNLLCFHQFLKGLIVKFLSCICL